MQLFEIASDRLSLKAMRYGAVIQDLRLAGVAHPLVLGLNSLEDYQAHSPYFGAVAGRYANRIAGGRFEVQGKQIQLDRNQGGKHCLHGGAASFGKRDWALTEQSTAALTFEIHEAHGSNGFPGALTAQVRYELDGATLRVTLSGQSDAETLCNLTQHSYFNLDGKADILGHRLEVAAKAYTPVDDEAIPTGAVIPVRQTAFDFTAPRALTDAVLHQFDHNFCLAASANVELRYAAKLSGSDGQVAMTVWTTEPGLQVYAGHKINVPVPGLEGRSYGAHAGIALEAQVWPDSPNRPYFPQAWLKSGDTYRHVTEYRFDTA